MKFCTTLIAVRDMERSLRFYRNLFAQEVTQDLGWNKTLTCGLTLQEHFAELAGFPAETMKYQPNTMELYFETETFDEFLATLRRYPDVKLLHEPKTFPWLQRGVRIFDPDGHLIEVSESMYSVARRQFQQGKTIAETAGLIQHPQHVVEAWYLEYQSENMDKTTEVIPYLSFNGNCEEAVNAYIDAFGGEIYGMSRWTEKNFDMTPEQIGKIMHVEFAIGSTHMAAGDAFASEEGNTDIKLMIHMDSEPKALHAIAALAKGGTILTPLRPHPEPDDAGCGSMTKDRFGFTWIITCPNPAKQ